MAADSRSGHDPADAPAAVCSISGTDSSCSAVIGSDR
jgi:hypothetical protein